MLILDTSPIWENENRLIFRSPLSKRLDRKLRKGLVGRYQLLETSNMLLTLIRRTISFEKILEK